MVLEGIPDKFYVCDCCNFAHTTSEIDKCPYCGSDGWIEYKSESDDTDEILEKLDMLIGFWFSFLRPRPVVLGRERDFLEEPTEPLHQPVQRFFAVAVAGTVLRHLRIQTVQDESDSRGMPGIANA